MTKKVIVTQDRGRVVFSYEDGKIPVPPSFLEKAHESMDGDHVSALASAGFGMDEDYGYFGGDDR